jgi:RsmE family RNA methyltransferase
MNLILFEIHEIDKEINRRDPRSIHIREILNLKCGDEFGAGVIEGSIGRGRLTAETKTGYQWEFIPLSDPPPPLRPVTLILGCPRPPVARRLLKDMSTLGILELRACTTDLNEKSYLASRLWRDGIWREALIEGASQAATTLLPEVKTGPSLESILEELPDSAVRIALDNAPLVPAFAEWKADYHAAILAVGPERGWSGRERELLNHRGFVCLNLGRRILRTETACSVGCALILAGMGGFT